MEEEKKSFFIDEELETEFGYIFDVGHELVKIEDFKKECDDDFLIMNFYNDKFHHIAEDSLDFYNSENYIERAKLLYIISILKFINLSDLFNEFHKFRKTVSLFYKINDKYRKKPINKFEDLSKKDIDSIFLLYEHFEKSFVQKNSEKVLSKILIFDLARKIDVKNNISVDIYDRILYFKSIIYSRIKEINEREDYKYKLIAKTMSISDETDFNKKIFTNYIQKATAEDFKLETLTKKFKTEVSRTEDLILRLFPYITFNFRGKIGI